MEHTKEPWCASQEGGEWRVMASDAEGSYTIADMHSDNTEADARRIVAAVNASAGIPTHGLEGISFAVTLAEFAECQQQRDELLAALEAICSDHDFCGDEWGSRRDAWIETARAAIAKARA